MFSLFMHPKVVLSSIAAIDLFTTPLASIPPIIISRLVILLENTPDTSVHIYRGVKLVHWCLDEIKPYKWI